MISAWWLLPTAWISATLGFLLASILKVGSDADDRIEAQSDGWEEHA